MRAAGGVRGPINETLHLRAAIQNVAHVPSPAPSEIRALLMHRNLIPQQAEDLWTIAKKNNYMVDTPLTQAYLGYYAQRGDANAVKKGMDAMAQSGVIHHEKTYELLLRAHVNTENTVGLLKVFHQLSQENVTITEQGIQTIIITYFAKHPNLHEQIELFLALTSSDPKPHYKLLYHVLIVKLIKGTDLNADHSLKVKQLMKEMEAHGIVPLISTFEALMHSDIVEYEQAQDYFKQMKRHSLANTFAYAGMIHRNAQQGRLKECLRLWHEMLNHGLTPTPTAYNAIMQPLAISGQSVECAKMFDDMLLRGIRPSILTFTILAQGYVTDGNLPRARTVLEDMSQRGVRPDGRMYHMLVRAHADAGDAAQCVALISRAYGSGLDAGSLLSTLIGAYGDSDAKESHDELLRDMRMKGVVLPPEIKDAILRRQATVPHPFSFISADARTNRFPSPAYSPPPAVPRLHVPSSHRQEQPIQSPPSPSPSSSPNIPTPEAFSSMYPYPYPYPYPYYPYYQYPMPPQPQSPDTPQPASTTETNNPPTTSPSISTEPISPDLSTNQTSDPLSDSSFTPTSDNSSDSPSNDAVSNDSPSFDSSSTTSSPDIDTSESELLDTELNTDTPTPTPTPTPSSPISSIPPINNQDINNNVNSELQPQNPRPPRSPFRQFNQMKQEQSQQYQRQHHQNDNQSRNNNFKPSYSRPPRNYSDEVSSSYSSSSSSSSSSSPLDITKIQSNNSVIQRLKRRNERQEKLIQKLQSRNDLNSLILDKLHKPDLESAQGSKLQGEIAELEKLKKKFSVDNREVTPQSLERLEKLKRHQQESRLEKRLQEEQREMEKKAKEREQNKEGLPQEQEQKEGTEQENESEVKEKKEP